ncbi:Ssu1p [Sugiyamaella lignohabitans]|uniref:Ssu1p n=1 Tax=Sugiyamaella lignohabitans TaxID=796027 RepID=A0A167CTW1_9ASCO|nr:Ssu1p [Sugiyamaella lignohabitans]ANB12100.1 Ssu1p [Sugiyamaella lignohabitans]
MFGRVNSNASSETVVNHLTMTAGIKSYLLARVNYFTPAWFAAVMGVGISSIILYTFPFNARWLRILGVIIWGFNMGLFGIANILFVSRFLLHPAAFAQLLRDPTQSVFLGCWPMGFATIINMTDLQFGRDAWKATYAMWWIDVFVSLFTAWYVVFCMYSKHDRKSTESINATILLPVVAVVVASSTGALITANLPKQLQESTIIITALLWGNGELLGFTCTAIYIHRLLRSNLPPSQLAISNFLPVGPLGQGSFGIIIITSNLATLLAERQVLTVPESALVRYAGIGIAMAMMGYACFWVSIAFLAILTDPPKSFNPGWWGLTFPLGTFVLGWYRLADETGLLAFKVLGAIFGGIEVLLALTCTIQSINHAVIHDTLFRAPTVAPAPNSQTVDKETV